MKVKICGLKRPANIDQILSCQPDYVGFVFYKSSPRYAGDTLSPVHMQHIDSTVGRVGVFVDEQIEKVVETVQQFCLSHVQLHGAESVQYIEGVRRQMPGIPVLKAFSVGDSFQFSEVTAYRDLVSAVMFDTPTPGHGGSGKAFQWDRLKEYTNGPRFFLSGGLSCENVARAREIVREHPLGEGLDASSSLEREAGLKAFSLVRTFIDEARK